MIKNTKTKYGNFFVLENDIFISGCLDRYGEWSESEMIIYETFIKKNSVVIEVGSHIGSFTVPIANLAKTVFAFEPQRIVFQVFNSNLIQNNIYNVYSYMHAVGSINKDILLKEINYESDTTIQGFNSGGVHLNQIQTEEDGYPCRQIRLDDFMPKNTIVNFIKIDAEEMEIEVLKGANNLIKNNKPVMYVESHISNKELPEYIKKLGYKVFEHMPPYFNPNNFKENQDTILQLNKNIKNFYDYMLLCVPNEMPFKTDLKQLK